MTVTTTTTTTTTAEMLNQVPALLGFCFVLQPSSIRGLTTPWTYFLQLSLSSLIQIDSSTGSPHGVTIVCFVGVKAGMSPLPGDRQHCVPIWHASFRTGVTTFANYYYKCMLIIVTPSRGRCMGTFVIIMEQCLLKLGMSSAAVEQYGVARTANVKLFLRLMFSPLLTRD